MLWTIYLLFLAATSCKTQVTVNESSSFFEECDERFGLKLVDDGVVDGGGMKGKVEFRYNNDTRIYICDDGWNDEAAKMVCEALNLPVRKAKVIDGSVDIGQYDLLLNLSCFKTEDTLYECLNNSVNNTVNCTERIAATVNCLECDPGEVRLGPLYNETEGVVEICDDNSQWGWVCDDWWDEEDNNASFVACNSTVYSGRVLNAEKLDVCADVEGQFFLDDVKCVGNELSLFDCMKTEKIDCILAEAVSINCTVSEIDPPTPPPPLKNIRLVEGNETSGLVEVYRDGEWRSVCDDFWTGYDGMVACRELCLLPYFSSVYLRGIFKPGVNASYWLDDMKCKGKEESLFDCKHLEPTGDHNCGRRERAGVHCLNSSELEIRLSPDDNSTVEVRIREEWGYICDHFFDNDDATVVCRQLGYDGLGKVKKIDMKEGNDTIYWMGSVHCRGDEETIFDCGYLINVTCNMRVGVKCNGNRKEIPVLQPTCPEDPEPPMTYIFSLVCPPPQEPEKPEPTLEPPRPDTTKPKCPDVAVRLVNSNDDFLEGEGLVQICMAGEWRYVCDDDWDKEDAAIVCRELNMTSTNIATIRGKTYNVSETYVHYWLDNVMCNGTESSLLDCETADPAFHDCGPNEIATVMCDGTSVTIESIEPNKDIRILGRSKDFFEKSKKYAIGANSTLTGENNTINGFLKIIPLEDGVLHVTLNITSELEANVLYDWGISNDTYYTNNMTCPTSVYDPDNNIEGMCNYKKDCKNKNKDKCPVGDYSARFDQLNGAGVGIVNETRISLTDMIGRFFFIEGGGQVACGVIIPEFVCDEGDIVMTTVAFKVFLGPLEVCIEGRWHRVCDLNWTRDDAMVACRQLELEYEGTVAVYFNEFEVLQNNDLENVTATCSCEGNERNLYDCFQDERTRRRMQGEKVSGALCQEKKPELG